MKVFTVFIIGYFVAVLSAAPKIDLLHTKDGKKYYYLPKVARHMSVRECDKYLVEEGNRRFTAEGSTLRLKQGDYVGHCEWYGGMDVLEECIKGFQAEQQMCSGGFGCSELPVSRTICIWRGR